MKIKEVLSHLEQKFPLSYQEDFDNCGIQCGDKEREITGVLVCFEMSDETIDEAIALNANLVISHHPLMLKRGIQKIEPTNRVGRILCKALENRMVLYSMHTNLDSAPEGVNDLFAKKLNLQNVSVLEPNEKYFSAPSEGEGKGCMVGLGRVGNLPAPMSAEKFLLSLKEIFGVPAVRYYGDLEKPVQRVALCGGSGGSYIGTAQAAGADVYVSGDIKYHDFHTADRKMLIADIGHLESEQFVKEIIFNEIKENFTNFAVSFTKVEKMRISII